MKIFQIESGIHNDYHAYLVKIDKHGNYLCIGVEELDSVYHNIGELYQEEDADLVESSFKLTDSPLYGTYLFDFWLSTYKFEEFEPKFISNVGLDNEEIVDLDTAKFMKNSGFSAPTYWYYQDKSFHFSEKGLKRVKYNQKRMNHNKYDEWIYSAPTKQQYLTWLKNK